MRKILSILTVAIFMVVANISANATDFFDKGKPKQLIGIGVRAGINRSGLNWSETGLSQPIFNKDCTGFDLGAVVNLNIRNYFTIQPGFIFQNKAHDAYFNESDLGISKLHARYYSVQIPIMFQFNFNLAKAVRWSVAAGPVISFGLGGNNTFTTENGTFKDNYYGKNEIIFAMKRSKVRMDFGTSFTFAKHYVVGFTYHVGCGNELYYVGDIPKIKARPHGFSVVVGYDF